MPRASRRCLPVTIVAGVLIAAFAYLSTDVELSSTFVSGPIHLPVAAGNVKEGESDRSKVAVGNYGNKGGGWNGGPTGGGGGGWGGSSNSGNGGWSPGTGGLKDGPFGTKLNASGSNFPFGLFIISMLLLVSANKH